MSSAASQQRQRRMPPASAERRERDDMPGQQQQQTQDIIRQLSDMFTPRLKEIQDKLDTLVTRREHDKDLTEINADIATLQRDRDRMQAWAEKRPRESADVEWVRRIEADVTAINVQLKQQPAETRAWFNTALSGGGCLYMFIGLCIVIIFDVLSIAASVIIALVMRGG